jgi:uncharacterized protein (TIGR03067 family)
MFTTLTCFVALAIAAPAKDVPPKKEMPSLVGEWKFEEGQAADKAVPIQKGELTLNFDAKGGMHLSMMMAGQKIDLDASYKIDLTKTPFEIDLIPPSGKADRNSLGIFKIEGDTLTICSDDSGKMRPIKFETVAGNGAITLLKFKRIDPKGK